MDDLISRAAAIDAMERAKEQYFDRKVIIGKMQDIVSNLPSQQEQQWIPVSERLPEKNGRYLVTNTRWGAYELDWDIFYKEQNDWLFGKDVTAWMPLPEPYVEKGDA